MSEQKQEQENVIGSELAVTGDNGDGLIRTEMQVAESFGKRSEIREMVDRLRAGLPNGNKLPSTGLRALAAVCLTHELDPFLGEAWLIYNEKTESCSVMAGIKGLRKAAKRQLADREFYDIRSEPIQRGSQMWKVLELDTPDKKGREVELACFCHLRRTDAMTRYIEHLDLLHKITGSYEEAKAILGPAPVYTGIGIVRKGEESKMERSQLVRKRAEADALKCAFDLPFATQRPANAISLGVPDDEWDNDNVINGNATEGRTALPDLSGKLYPDEDFEGFDLDDKKDKAPKKVEAKSNDDKPDKTPATKAAQKSRENAKKQEAEGKDGIPSGWTDESKQKFWAEVTELNKSANDVFKAAGVQSAKEFFEKHDPKKAWGILAQLKPQPQLI